MQCVCWDVAWSEDEQAIASTAEVSLVCVCLALICNVFAGMLPDQRMSRQWHTKWRFQHLRRPLLGVGQKLPRTLVRAASHHEECLTPTHMLGTCTASPSSNVPPHLQMSTVAWRSATVNRPSGVYTLDLNIACKRPPGVYILDLTQKKVIKVCCWKEELLRPALLNRPQINVARTLIHLIPSPFTTLETLIRSAVAANMKAFTSTVH
eukprot:1157308-Pelagomonas_calceolata.AAC.3